MTRRRIFRALQTTLQRIGAGAGCTTIPQEKIDEINQNLKRAIQAPPDPEDQKLFAIQRFICHRAQVSDLPASGRAIVSVHDEIRRSKQAIGELVSTRSVGPFIVRLVRGQEEGCEDWWIVESNTRSKGVVLLGYQSSHDQGRERSREAATRYAAEATETDMTSDLNPEAHFFGERRCARPTNIWSGRRVRSAT